MNEQELNRKLAEWAGFDLIFQEASLEWFLVSAEKHRVDITELFTKSLDACFKWLVPKSKMDILWIINNLDSPRPEIAYAFGYSRSETNDLLCWSKRLPVEECLSPIEETPALAICRAIEKLIDNEVGASASKEGGEDGSRQDSIRRL